jgi:hypothetical protein
MNIYVTQYFESGISHLSYHSQETIVSEFVSFKAEDSPDLGAYVARPAGEHGAGGWLWRRRHLA